MPLPGRGKRLARRRRRIPERAELGQFGLAQRLGGTGVAPAHVPGVFDEDRMHVLVRDRAIEYRLVEIPKSSLT